MIENVITALYNWYDAAWYFVHRADFLRVLNVRNFQTIAILGVAFIKFR
jgi:hypothetical protein